MSGLARFLASVLPVPAEARDVLSRGDFILRYGRVLARSGMFVHGEYSARLKKEKDRVEPEGPTPPPLGDRGSRPRTGLDDRGHLGLPEDLDRLSVPRGEQEARLGLGLDLGRRPAVDGLEVVRSGTRSERLAVPAVEPTDPRGLLLALRAGLLTEDVGIANDRSGNSGHFLAFSSV